MYQAQVNPYRGCFIGPDQLPGQLDDAAIAEFSQRLAARIMAWQTEYRLIWLELPATLAGLIPAALAAGFEFHHCQSQQLMMVKKLQPDSYVPLAATHSVGVGAVVWSEQGQVLLVRELALPGQSAGYFKLPGGMVEPAEHLADAVVREVLEETGVQAVFQSLLGFRHHHQGQFGASNLYFVCQLMAQTTELTPAVDEIAELGWFWPEDYLQDEKASAYNKLILNFALKHTGFAPCKVPGYRADAQSYEIFFPAIPVVIGE